MGADRMMFSVAPSPLPLHPHRYIRLVSALCLSAGVKTSLLAAACALSSAGGECLIWSGPHRSIRLRVGKSLETPASLWGQWLASEYGRKPKGLVNMGMGVEHGLRIHADITEGTC